MVLQFRIFVAESTGQSGAGGGVVPTEVTNIVPSSVAPYLGEGPKYIYRKYFLNIVDYDDRTGMPTISNVSVGNITANSAVVSYTTDQPTTTDVKWGPTLYYGSEINSGTVLTSGNRSVLLGGLSEELQYYYKIIATNIDSIPRYSYGSFSTIRGTPPVFSHVQAGSITASGAIIMWDTDESSSSQVGYGTGVISSYTALDSSLVTSHSVQLTGLVASTNYLFKVISLDQYGNSGQYPTAGNLLFVTAGTSGAPALTITNVSSGAIGDTSGTITWTTSNPADTTIRYSQRLDGITGTGIGNYSVYHDGTFVTGHTGYITNLTPGRSIMYQPMSLDQYGQTTYAPSQTGAYTLSTPDTTAPIITFNWVSGYGTSGTVNFNTNENATGYIDYDTTLNYTNNSGVFGFTKTGTLGTAHTITFSGLSSNRAYTFRCKANDLSGNYAYDGARALTTADITAPVISSLFSGTTTSQVVFNWQTDELATTELFLGNGTIGAPNIFTGTTGNNGNLVLSHTARIQSLNANTSYVYVVESTDAAGNSADLTGLVSTQAVGGGDTTPPVISNLGVVPAITEAAVTWDTDEYSSTIVNYSNVSNLSSATGATGQSGTLHAVTLSGLDSSSTYYFRPISTDASNNTVSGAINSFTTNADTSASNFAIGTTVAALEFELPVTLSNVTAPIRACVPVKDNGDLTYNWRADNGYYCQREVIKRNGAGDAKIVEVVFPYVLNGNAGDKITIYLTASQQGPTTNWTQYAIPSTEINVVMPNGIKTTANLVGGTPTQVRGNTSSPYCRTYKYYNRFTYQAAADNYHPEAQSFQLHSYVTHYNSTLFPSFYPNIDVRVSNAWIDESNPTGSVGIATGGQTNRGAIYYNTMNVRFPGPSTDGISFALTPDILENGQTEQATSVTLVNTHSAYYPPIGATTPPCATPLLAPGSTPTAQDYLGGSSTAYSTVYVNDQSNNAMMAGSALSYRLAMYPRNNATAKALMKKVAGLEFIAFCYKDENPPDVLNPARRSWSTTRSFGPMNIFAPTVKNSGTTFTYGGVRGRAAVDLQAKAAWTQLVYNLQNGTNINDGLTYGNVGYLGTGLGPVPVQFGPYRPGDATDGGAPGGQGITPWDGFNHSKYAILWKVLSHKMISHRHYQRMYSVSDGEPSSFTKWIAQNPGTNSTMANGGQNIHGVIPFFQYLDFRAAYFEKRWPAPGDANYSAPWNRPTILVTDPPTPGQGCWYHNDLVNYIGGAYSSYTNNRVHINDTYMPIDHAHQIRYVGNLIAIAELLNDIMSKDDLKMQAELNMISMCHYPTSSTGYTMGYNLAEIYYGFNRASGGGYDSPGIYGNQHQGWQMGRIYAWPLWTVNAAYQLGSDTFRAYAIDNLNLSTKIFSDGYMIGNGTINRAPGKTSTVSMLQHPGLSTNGIRVYLQPGVSGPVAGYSKIGLTDIAPSSTTVTIGSANTDTLIGSFIASNDTTGGVDSPYNSWSTINGDINFYVNNWINASGITNSSPAWRMSTWTLGSTGMTYRLRLRLYLYNPVTQQELRISNDTLNHDEYSVTATNTGNAQNLTWIVKQANPSNGGAYETFSPIINGVTHHIVAKLYVNATTTGTLTFYYGSSSSVQHSSRLDTAIKDVSGCPYDFAQIFENNLIHLAHAANTTQVIKPYAVKYVNSDLTTRSRTILTAIRKYYNEFYNLAPMDKTVPGTVSNSSTWQKYQDFGNLQYGDSWLIALAYSTNYPGGSTAPFTWGTELVTAEGKFADTPPEPGQYSTYGSIIGIIAMMDLGASWDNNPNPSSPSYTSAFLLMKWCLMGSPDADPFSHRDRIFASNSPLYLNNSACAIGFINYYYEYP